MKHRYLLPLFAAALLSACSAAPNYDIDNTVRIFQTLSADEMAGRRAGTEGGAKARAFILSEMEATGAFDAITQERFLATPRPNRETGEVSPPVEAINIHGLIDVPNDDTGPLLVITAHYDHLGTVGEDIYNGADDNASGSAALFAIAQSFKDSPPDHDVLFIWFDAEEMSLQGAKHYVGAVSYGERPVFNINLDMISQNSDGEIYASGTHHMPALEPILTEAASRHKITMKFGNDKPEDGNNDWTLQSDHAAFHRAGLPYIYFGVVDHPHYHRPSDTFETVPLPFYKQSVALIVDASHAIDESLSMVSRPAIQFAD